MHRLLFALWPVVCPDAEATPRGGVATGPEGGPPGGGVVVDTVLGPEDKTSRVAIVAGSEGDPLARLLRGELSTLGFSSEVHIETDEPGTVQELRAIAEREHVDAAIWVSPDHRKLLIWVPDRRNDRVILRSLERDDGFDAEEDLVLRGVEQLRASLRDTQVHSPEPVLPEPVLPELEQEPRPEASAQSAQGTLAPSPCWSRAQFRVGPAVVAAPGGLGPSVQVAVGVRWMPHPKFGVELQALGPTAGVEVSSLEGRARVYVAHVVVGPRFLFRPPTKRVQPDVGVSVGVSIVRMDGRAEAPRTGQVAHVLGVTGLGGAGISVAVLPVLAIRADAAVGVVGPAPKVAFSSRIVARFGQPYGLGVVSLEFRTPRRPRASR